MYYVVWYENMFHEVNIRFSLRFYFNIREWIFRNLLSKWKKNHRVDFNVVEGKKLSVHAQYFQQWRKYTYPYPWIWYFSILWFIYQKCFVAYIYYIYFLISIKKYSTFIILRFNLLRQLFIQFEKNRVLSFKYQCNNGGTCIWF